MDNTTQNNINIRPENNNASSSPRDLTPSNNKKPMGLIIFAVSCAILAIGGFAFGIYELSDSNKKSQQISDLQTSVSDRGAKIEELKAKIDSADSGNKEAPTEPTEGNTPNQEPEKARDGKTAEIVFMDVIEDNEERAVFKIGECSSDATSVKCPVGVDGRDALISFQTEDGLLRLTIPKN